MTKRRKVCVVTGTRAEYGLLYWTIKRLSADPFFELQLLVTGMHLSPEFGLTYQQITADGFEITKKVEMLLSSDTTTGICKSIGVGVMGMGDAFAELQPDLVLLLGDRFEIFAAATAAMINRIPIAHCHGGETTEGAFDESIRHAVTKMSHLHFTATDVYRNRVIQLGEDPKRVFNAGALGIESIHKLSLLDKAAFEESISFSLGEKNMLVTFHPVTLEHGSAATQFTNLLEALDSLEDTRFIFTKANADTDGRIINQMIDEYVSKHPNKAVAFTSLGHLRYLSAIQHMDVVIGNSSSGLLEVPVFRKATVNIGDRQAGRIRGASVIDCLPETADIKKAIAHAYSPAFQEQLATVAHPYGDGQASEKIIGVLKEVTPEQLLKKKFHDIG